MVWVVVVEAASLKGTSLAVLSLVHKVKRIRINPLHEIPEQQRISLEACRIADNVRLSLTSARISTPLDAKEFRVGLLL